MVAFDATVQNEAMTRERGRISRTGSGDNSLLAEEERELVKSKSPYGVTYWVSSR